MVTYCLTDMVSSVNLNPLYLLTHVLKILRVINDKIVKYHFNGLPTYIFDPSHIFGEIFTRIR